MRQNQFTRFSALIVDDENESEQEERGERILKSSATNNIKCHYQSNNMQSIYGNGAPMHLRSSMRRKKNPISHELGHDAKDERNCHPDDTSKLNAINEDKTHIAVFRERMRA